MEQLFVVWAVLYGVWVVVCLVVRSHKVKVAKRPAGSKNAVLPEDIMGKCLFARSHSQPQAATRAQTSEAEVKANTFVPEAEKGRVARVANDELDVAFSDTPEFEVKEVPLEWEDDLSISYEQEEQELFGQTQYTEHYASGVLYEDMDQAVYVAQKEEPTKAERQKAGETFSELEGSDLYGKLMLNAPLLEQRIRALLDHSLRLEPRAMPDDIAHFDIRDFM